MPSQCVASQSGTGSALHPDGGMPNASHSLSSPACRLPPVSRHGYASDVPVTLIHQSRNAMLERALALFHQNGVSVPTMAQKSRWMFLQQYLLRRVRTPDFRYHVNFHIDDPSSQHRVAPCWSSYGLRLTPSLFCHRPARNPQRKAKLGAAKIKA